MTWTVNRRIALGFALILSLIVVLGAFAIVTLRRATAAYEQATREEVQLATLLEAESQSREAAIEQLRFMLDPTQERFLTARDSAVRRANALLEQLHAEIGDAEARAEIERIRAVHADWERGAADVTGAALAGRAAEARRIWEERALPLRNRLRGMIEDNIDRGKERSRSMMSAAEAQSARMQWVLALGGLLILGIGIVSAVLLSRAVTRPLQETTGVLASSAAEILAATTQQASGASETSAAVVETSTTVDEVAQTAAQAADRAQSLEDSARRAADIGQRGRRAVEESVAAMTGVREQVESIADSILILAEQAQAIGEIIATVDDIAEQTNLLALNAAVEAARAGEHGRGFSVVAGEIRALADQSKRATVQVRQMLGEIQRATSAAVMTTERGTQQVNAGSAQVTEAGETIRALAEAVAEAAQAAAQIVASAGQQAAGMTQIRQAMASIHEATQQNLSATRQAEQTAQDLNRLGLRLLALVGSNGRPDGRGQLPA